MLWSDRPDNHTISSGQRGDQAKLSEASEPPENPPASNREILSWALFDFANSSYVTVVCTAIFHAYFVRTVAGSLGTGKATLLLTSLISISNLIIVLTAPVIGTIADFTARKKPMLLFTSILLAVFTALLSCAGPGDVYLALFVLGTANVMYGTGENLIAAFLPEIASRENMGRVSALGWSIGYFGGILALALCLGYVFYAEGQSQRAAQYVPVTMWIVAGIFSLAALPTFLFLKERALPLERPEGKGFVAIGFERLGHTVSRASQFRDLFVFLLCILFFTCGSTTVASIAAVYAEQVMGFKTSDTIAMIMVVNLAGSIGAFTFGAIQDRLGSRKAVAYSLVIWIVAVLTVMLAASKTVFWIGAMLMGAATGASQSSARALVGRFAPPERSAEFFGLWGLSAKLATIIGPLSFGALSYLIGGNYRLSLISTLLFFVLSLITLGFVDENRGIASARGESV
ncbi:MAG: MFS transporter [Cyanobacteria bacterium HKST-UBA02]|nr:MFS transporter [Cyanobacteria bacterium HKST-UBA02]